MPTRIRLTVEATTTGVKHIVTLTTDDEDEARASVPEPWRVIRAEHVTV